MAVRVCAVGLIFSVCIMLLREVGWRGAPIFASVSALAIVSIILPGIKEVTEGLSSLLSTVGAQDTVRSVLKIIGLAYLFGICADICRDLGAERVGSAVLLAGRIEILLIAIPYVVKMLKLGMELIG